MLFIRISLLIFAMLFAHGCTLINTVEKSVKESQNVPPDRNFQKVVDVAGAIEFTVKRDDGHSGSKCLLGFKVDGELQALFGPGEAIKIRVPKKLSYEIAVIPNPYDTSWLCGNWTPTTQKVNSDFMTNAIFRITVNLGEVSLNRSIMAD